MPENKKKEKITYAEGIMKMISEQQLENPLTPIQNFKYNMLKARILAILSQEIVNVWPMISKKLIEKKHRIWSKRDMNELEETIDDFAIHIESGITSYTVFTHQALVLVVSSMETYLKDKLADTIKKDPRLLNPHSDKDIKIRRIIECGLDLKDDIGKLIVEKIKFQQLKQVNEHYEKTFGFKPLSKKNIKNINKILQMRHVIVHNSGYIDKKYLSNVKSKLREGQLLVIHRDELLRIIDYVEKIVSDVESQLSQKYSMNENI